MTGTRIHTIEVPVEDVAATRIQTVLSSSAFARSIGAAKGTLLNWEHGRRQPTGPALVLLAMIATLALAGQRASGLSSSGPVSRRC